MGEKPMIATDPKVVKFPRLAGAALNSLLRRSIMRAAEKRFDLKALVQEWGGH
jgi:hypothetical protein